MKVIAKESAKKRYTYLILYTTINDMRISEYPMGNRLQCWVRFGLSTNIKYTTQLKMNGELHRMKVHEKKSVRNRYTNIMV